MRKPPPLWSKHHEAVGPALSVLREQQGEQYDEGYRGMMGNVLLVYHVHGLGQGWVKALVGAGVGQGSGQHHSTSVCMVKTPGCMGSHDMQAIFDFIFQFCIVLYCSTLHWCNWWSTDQ